MKKPRMGSTKAYVPFGGLIEAPQMRRYHKKSQEIIVTIHKFTLIITEMHASATAELPHLAVGTLIGLCPLAVAEGFKSILPYIPETIFVDITLGIVATHTCTARNVAINTN